MQTRFFPILFFLVAMVAPVRLSGTVKTGAERMDQYLPLIKGKRVGLVVNHTSVVGAGQTHLLDTLLSRNVRILKVFAPEHGFRGNADAGEMVKDGKDSRTGIPIVSLYVKSKKPTAAQLKDIDVLIFDIQDVGARFYTYISTMLYVMEACVENKKELIVLDRPNPCDYVDGPILRPAFRSFVGMLPIPVLHGCTVGELALMINGEGWTDDKRWNAGKERMNEKRNPCPLKVIPMLGWKHGEPYSLPIKPSPNLPNDQSIRLYASLCPFEATRISVGRGTTFPFQVLGAPDKKYGDFTFTPRALPGFDKNPMHKNITCYGEDLRSVTDTKGFTLRYFLDFYRLSGDGATFFSRPRWFDLLMGTDSVRKAILKGESEETIRNNWQKELEDYKEIRKKYLLYGKSHSKNVLRSHDGSLLSYDELQNSLSYSYE